MKHKALWITLGVIVVLAMFFVGTYNGLAKSDENVNNKWAQVQTVYQRRADLIPNLVATVQGASNFEKSTLIAVTEARTKWLNAGTQTEKVQAANQLEGTLARLLVVAENYPELKSNANYLALQDELANTENKISVERQRYNDAVTAFNAKLRVFPSNMIGSMFGFEKRVYFESSAGAENAPQVAFT
ncbi:MAG: LemA family protein [Nanoarchaeota archaeon]|nr:LemA family protein [Nanoarchaeota archaeon]